MTTHAATQQLLTPCNAHVPLHKSVRVGKGSCVVVLNNKFSPALISLNYKWDDENRKGPITLANFLEDQQILLPAAMIKAHVTLASI
jgi:hypothetical protein